MVKSLSSVSGVCGVMQVRRVEDERAAAGQTVFRYQAFVHICKVNTHTHIQHIYGPQSRHSRPSGESGQGYLVPVHGSKPGS